MNTLQQRPLFLGPESCFCTQVKRQKQESIKSDWHLEKFEVLNVLKKCSKENKSREIKCINHITFSLSGSRLGKKWQFGLVNRAVVFNYF